MHNEIVQMEADVVKVAQKVGAFVGRIRTATDTEISSVGVDCAATLELNCRVLQRQLDKLRFQLRTRFGLED